MNTEKLKKVRDEIKGCFDKWDERVNNNQQPVPIQDLDYWQTKLSEIIGEAKE